MYSSSSKIYHEQLQSTTVQDYDYDYDKILSESSLVDFPPLIILNYRFLIYMIYHLIRNWLTNVVCHSWGGSIVSILRGYYYQIGCDQDDGRDYHHNEELVYTPMRIDHIGFHSLSIINDDDYSLVFEQVLFMIDYCLEAKIHRLSLLGSDKDHNIPDHNQENLQLDQDHLHLQDEVELAFMDTLWVLLSWKYNNKRDFKIDIINKDLQKYHYSNIWNNEGEIDLTINLNHRYFDQQTLNDPIDVLFIENISHEQVGILNHQEALGRPIYSMGVLSINKLNNLIKDAEGRIELL